ncbi:SDR family oxidoreductase [Aquibium oceanicum]|uniref:NAD(P)-dependent oxidoreductase n=1 Tax=Aquibium oceanicum TaxID=1670800 RepID=A0A1L3STD1_9HYPH|nr:SDR family oxidoreductase [Aquibium oceanicum]APH72693.1 NAD(P)-dependent oxidoreductase [Aquibium oceanicum]
MSDKILVTGASGQLGGAVIRHLLETEGVAPARVVAVTRDPAKLSALAGRGVDVRAGSFDEEAGLTRAFAGADTVLIVSTDDVLTPGLRLRQHLAAVSAAKAAGAGRIAYTSMPSPEPGNPVLFASDHHGTENAIRASGIPHSIFRNGWYHENLMRSLPAALASGNWYTSAGEGRTSYILRDDIARAIAAGLARPDAGNATYTLSGTQAFTNGEIAAMAGEVLGKPIAVVNLTDEQLAEGLKAAGLPEPAIPLIVSLEAATRAGVLGTVTQDVERLTGREPSPLKAWLEANRGVLAG